MRDRRSALVTAFKRAGVGAPTPDDIDTAAGQLDAIVEQGTKVPSAKEADQAVEACAEVRRRGAEKFARLQARKEQALQDIARLKAERQKHRDERRKLQARREKRRESFK